MPGDDQQVDPPARSTHAGELYRFQAARWQKIPALVFTAVYLIVMAELGGHLLADPGRSGSSVIGVVLILAGVGGAALLWRIIESRVVITEHGLRIRNHLRSYALPWDEIEGYEAAGHHYLRLADGRRIRLFGLATGPLGSTARTVREAGCLNAEIERHKQAQTAAVTPASPA